jgi:hypothetical protein
MISSVHSFLLEPLSVTHGVHYTILIFFIVNCFLPILSTISIFNVMHYSIYKPVCALIFILSAGLWHTTPVHTQLQIGSQGIRGAVPQPASAEYNPAFGFIPDIQQTAADSRIPGGFLGLLVPQRNPFLFFTDREKFRRNFDFLSFYDQLHSPYEFLITPSVSPEELNIIIEDNILRIDTGSKGNLKFSSSPGSGGVSLPGSPLIPMPLVRYILKSEHWINSTGIFAGSSGYRITPNHTLQDLLEGESMEPSTNYRIDGQIAVDSGISNSSSFLISLPAESSFGSWFLVPRLTLYARIAYAEIDSRINVHTDLQGLPESVDSNTSAFILYPGKGYGGGARIDLGTALLSDPWRFGVSILSLYGIDIMKGEKYEADNLSIETEGTPELLIESDIAPLVFASASYLLNIRQSGLLIGINGGIHQEFSLVNLLIRLEKGKWIGDVHGGWQGIWNFGAGISYIYGSRTAGLTCSIHTSPFTDSISWGIGLRFGRGGRQK